MLLRSLHRKNKLLYIFRNVITLSKLHTIGYVNSDWVEGTIGDECGYEVQGKSPW